MLSCVVFDLDDTLCDYQQAKNKARTKINAYLEKIGLATEAFWIRYKSNESILMQQFLAHRIIKEEYRFHRFYDVLKGCCDDDIGLSKKLNKVFMREGNTNIALFGDVIPVLRKLREDNIQMAILTNGPSDGQREKIKSLGLDKYISKVYISEEMGASKPDKKIFEYALNDLGLPSSQILMVGDSIEYDYSVSEQVGVRFILIDRLNKMPQFEGESIRSLSDLMTILDSGFPGDL